jgi:ParB family chromosome partitioning protein
MTTSPRRAVLGRGLSALIPGGPLESVETSTLSAPHVLPIDQVRPSDRQPRTAFDDAAIAELSSSIRENGLIQPIIVRQVAPGDYAIIAGERRWRAATRAGLREVPVVVRDVTEAHAYQLALIENVQRQDLQPLEEAEAYHHLMEVSNLTQEEVARRVGKDRATVANALRLLRISDALKRRVVAGLLTSGHVRALLVLENEADQESLALEVEAHGWSVRETERAARALRAERATQGSAPDTPTQLSGTGAGSPAPTESNGRGRALNTEDPGRSPASRPAMETVEAQLRAALGAPVRLVHRAGSGRIEIRFHSLAELERLVDLVSSLEGT